MAASRSNTGFTLIELSIVLVIIGLIVGGVLTGQSLIAAAAVRAQISQIEKYNTAANTFYGKYSYLPGDIPLKPAAQFGLASRGYNAGEGDGNGVIEGVDADYTGTNSGFFQGTGETAMFWVDLSATHLIDGGFSTASSTVVPTSVISATSSPNLSAYFPAAKIGNGNYLLVYSINGMNYFDLAVLNNVDTTTAAHTYPGLTPQQAYAIDSKIDDGLPQSGRVSAYYFDWFSYIPAIGGGGAEAGLFGAINPVTASGSSTTCYDNSGVYNGTLRYSVAQPSATLNCALSFRFQSGD